MLDRVTTLSSLLQHNIMDSELLGVFTWIYIYTIFVIDGP